MKKTREWHRMRLSCSNWNLFINLSLICWQILLSFHFCFRTDRAVKVGHHFTFCMCKVFETHFLVSFCWKRDNSLHSIDSIISERVKTVLCVCIVKISSLEYNHSYSKRRNKNVENVWQSTCLSIYCDGINNGVFVIDINNHGKAASQYDRKLRMQVEQNKNGREKSERNCIFQYKNLFTLYVIETIYTTYRFIAITYHSNH